MILEISPLREDKTSALISSAAIPGLSVPVGGLGGWSRASGVRSLVVLVGRGVLALLLYLYFWSFAAIQIDTMHAVCSFVFLLLSFVNCWTDFDVEVAVLWNKYCWLCRSSENSDLLHILLASRVCHLWAGFDHTQTQRDDNVTDNY